MNAFVERFNRTIQEEHSNYRQWDLKDNLKTPISKLSHLIKK
jgi:hypothetical protein